MGRKGILIIVEGKYVVVSNSPNDLPKQGESAFCLSEIEHGYDECMVTKGESCGGCRRIILGEDQFPEGSKAGLANGDNVMVERDGEIITVHKSVGIPYRFTLIPVDREDFIKYGITSIDHQTFAKYCEDDKGFYILKDKKVAVTHHFAFQKDSLDNMKIHLTNLMMELTIMQQDENSEAINYRLQQTREFLKGLEEE